jgi:hypothetical protein
MNIDWSKWALLTALALYAGTLDWYLVVGHPIGGAVKQLSYLVEQSRTTLTMTEATHLEARRRREM